MLGGKSRDWVSSRKTFQAISRRSKNRSGGGIYPLKLSFGKLWEHDRRWVLWRLPIICAEESERFTGLSGRVEAREQAWNLLSSMTLSPKSKEAEGLRICSHIIVEEKWNQEDWVQGEHLFELRSWMAIQSELEPPNTDRNTFWKSFPVQEGYVGETITACQKRFYRGGMVSDKELLIVVGWMVARQKWEERPVLQVPAETDVEPLQNLPWWCYDLHTRIGKIVYYQLRKTFSTKKEVDYWCDDLPFNQESARVNELRQGSFWWPLALKMIWKRYDRSEGQAQQDWLEWAPMVRSVVEGILSERYKKSE